MNKLNVHQRINAVMNGMKTIAKNGYNNFHKYNFATEADFVHAIRPLLEEHGLVIVPEVLSHSRTTLEKDNILTEILMKFTVTNVDNPTESVSAVVLGQGTDKGDKGAYKAMTGAKKYFIAQTFMVATGDDPEDDKDDVKDAKRRSTPPKKEKSTLTVQEDF